MALGGWILLAGGASLGLFLYYGLPAGVCIVVGANVGFVGVMAGLIILSVWKGMGKDGKQLSGNRSQGSEDS